MKYIILHVVFMALCLFFAGCESSNNEDLSPSNADVDWFKVEDGSDPVQHLRYEIYKEYGLPVFYSDTIGMVKRGLSKDGNEIVHYEVIDLYYWITQRYIKQFDIELNEPYLKNRDMDEIKIGVEFIRDYVLTKLEAKKRPLSFLLVDKMVKFNSDKRTCHEHYAYYAMTTIVASRLGDIGTMTESEKKYHAGRIIAAIYVYDIFENVEKYGQLFNDFYALTPLKPDGKSRYGTSVGTTSNSSSAALLPGNDWLNWGFLRHSPNSMVNIKGSNSSYSPTLDDMQNKLIGYYGCTQKEDVYEYIAAVVADDEAAFKTTYALYPYIIAKYDKMKVLLQQYRDNIK